MVYQYLTAMASGRSLFNRNGKWSSRRSISNSDGAVIDQSLTAMVLKVGIQQQLQAMDPYFREGLAHQIVVL